MFLTADELKTTMYAHVIDEITEGDSSITEQAIDAAIEETHDDALDAMEGAIWLLNKKSRSGTSRYRVALDRAKY